MVSQIITKLYKLKMFLALLRERISFQPYHWTKSNGFCPAPWIHAHIDAAGGRRLCCLAYPPPAEYSTLPLSQFWNSDYMKKIRRHMMNNQLPDECINCKKPNKSDTYQNGLRLAFQKHTSKIAQTTQANGETTHPVVFIDYRSNKCNLMCKFCGPESSSRWIESAKKNAEILKLSRYEGHFDDIEKTYSQSQYSKEFLEIVKTNPIEKIYFAGGEPVLATQHFEVLDQLIADKKSKDIFLSYNTNLTHSETLMTSWLERLKQFKKVDIYCSIDGHEAVTTFIRTGLNYNQFMKNIEKLKLFKKNHRQFYFNFDVTMTSIFLLHLKEFSEMALKKQVPVDAKLMLGYDYKSLFLRCEFLSKELREQLINDWIKYYNSLNYNNAKLLVNLRNNLEIVRELPELDLNQKKEALKQVDIHRQIFPTDSPFESFFTKNPTAHSWFKNIQ